VAAAVETAASEVPAGKTPPGDKNCGSAMMSNHKTTQLRHQTVMNRLSKGREQREKITSMTVLHGWHLVTSVIEPIEPAKSFMDLLFGAP
jgi:hypothetical protein